MPATIKVFYSYAPADEQWRIQLEKHLHTLEQEGLITGWHAGKVIAGMDESYEIVTHIKEAHLILLLISPDFIYSDRCSKIEVPLAMERLKVGDTHIIPVLIRSIDWKGAPFGNLAPLPKNGTFITTWLNVDEGFANVAQGIREVVEGIRKKPLIESSKTSSSQIWNIPFRRNSFFTGREDILNSLHNMLATNSTAALTQPPAISGLGGVGKTQTAIEYAYRHRNDYQYVLWVKAGTQQTLVSDLVTIAGLLNLPQKDAQDQNLVVKAVKHWLETNANWLLIFDNADDLQMANDFLPSGSKGQVLLTTRAYSMGGIAQRVEVEEMKPEQGALFLLRRAGIIGKDAPLSDASEADSSTAREISEAMDGLPLALDQAGAFIEETGCSLTEYLTIYEKQQAELLKQRGGIAAPHPEPVGTTWSLSFEKVEEVNPAVADLLRFLAFLHPDAIPEEIITEGVSKLGPVLEPVASDAMKLNRAIGELLKYSLVRRDAKAKTLSVHRLVQAVLKDGMSEDEQRLWVERTVRAVDSAFPDPGKFEMWDLCKRCLPHAQVCAELISQWDMTFNEAARLLNQAAYYLDDHARYEEAEPLYKKAIEIGEKTLGPEHAAVATGLNNLAELYREQGKYEEAERLFQRAVAIFEKTLGVSHPNVAKVLENYASLLRKTNREAEATKLMALAKTIRAKHAQENPTDNNA